MKGVPPGVEGRVSASRGKEGVRLHVYICTCTSIVIGALRSYYNNNICVYIINYNIILIYLSIAAN